MARVFPVRDGWDQLGQPAGVQVKMKLYEPMCDGSLPPNYPDCGPDPSDTNDPLAQFKWLIIQSNPAGQLRSVCSPVTGSVPCQATSSPPPAYSWLNDGAGNVQTVLTPGTFVYFPGWLGNGADPAYDLNYNGVIEPVEMGPYVKSFSLDGGASWLTNIFQFQPGAIVRNWLDRDSSNTYTPGEPTSAFTDGRLITFMRRKASQMAAAYNRANPSSPQVNFSGFILWPSLDKSGTGGGTQYPEAVWAVTKPQPVMLQEFGHAMRLVPPGSPNACVNNPRTCNAKHSKNATLSDPRTFDPVKKVALNNPASVMAMPLSGVDTNSLLELYEYNYVFGQRVIPPLRTRDFRHLVLSIAGTVGEQDSLRRLHSVVTSDLPAQAAEEQSDYTLSVLDRGGIPLATEPIRIGASAPLHGDGVLNSDSATQFFHVARPWPANAAGFEIRHNGKLLLKEMRPQHRPVLLTASAQNNGRSIRLEWGAEHQDHSSLTYSVFYSGSGGDSWTPVAAYHFRTNLDIDPERLPPSARGIFRIEASDGFHTADIITNAVLVRGRPPLLHIAATHDPRTQKATLRAYVFDGCESDAQQARVRWESDSREVLGEGHRIETHLTGGPHVVTATLTNSCGFSVESRVRLERQ